MVMDKENNRASGSVNSKAAHPDCEAFDDQLSFSVSSPREKSGQRFSVHSELAVRCDRKKFLTLMHLTCYVVATNSGGRNVEVHSRFTTVRLFQYPLSSLYNTCLRTI